MKPCRFEELAHLYHAGALSPAERAAFEEHVLVCEHCREIAREVHEIRTMAASLGAHAPLAGLNERIMLGVKARQAKGAPDIQWAFLQRWQRALIPAALAACLILLLGIVYLPSKSSMVSQRGAPVQSAARTAQDTPSEYLMAQNPGQEDIQIIMQNSGHALSSHLDQLFQTN